MRYKRSLLIFFLFHFAKFQNEVLRVSWQGIEIELMLREGVNRIQIIDWQYIFSFPSS